MNRVINVRGSEDNLFSDSDETEDNYKNLKQINKKQLMKLENDESLTSVSDLYDNINNDNNTARNISNSDYSKMNNYLVKDNNNGNNKGNGVNVKIQGKVNNPHEDLLKFISDTSDIFGDNLIRNANVIKNSLLKPFNVNHFEEFFPSTYNRNFTFQSQTLSQQSLANSVQSNKYETLHIKYNELNTSHNTLIEIVNNFKEFYLKLLQIFLRKYIV
jgi:hypothetical protein